MASGRSRLSFRVVLRSDGLIRPQPAGSGPAGAFARCWKGLRTDTFAHVLPTTVVFTFCPPSPRLARLLGQLVQGLADQPVGGHLCRTAHTVLVVVVVVVVGIP